MEQRIIKKEIMEFYKICKKCGKEIKGTSKSHCEYNFDLHNKSCEKELKK